MLEEVNLTQLYLQTKGLTLDKVETKLETLRLFMYEKTRDAGLTLQEDNKRAMLECTDRFHSELHIRSRAIKEVAAMFEAVQAKSLISASEEELLVSIPKLTTFYDELC